MSTKNMFFLKVDVCKKNRIAIVQCHHQPLRLQISFFPFYSAASKNEIAESNHRDEKVSQ